MWWLLKARAATEAVPGVVLKEEGYWCSLAPPPSQHWVPLGVTHLPWLPPARRADVLQFDLLQEAGGLVPPLQSFLRRWRMDWGHERQK